MSMSSSVLGRLYDSLKEGSISRRDFMNRAAATGIGAGAALFFANSAAIAAAGGSKNGYAVYMGQDGTPSASPVEGVEVKPIDDGTEGQTRGEGGELKLLQWQAPTMAALHSSTGTKDRLAASLVSEPLLDYHPDGPLMPVLASEVPSVEGGTLAEDLTSVTFKLKEGLMWSDGEPFTANDVVFTWKWVTTASNASTNFEVWDVIKEVVATDDLTVEVAFKQPAAAWFEPFTTHTFGAIYPSHIFGDDTANKNEDFWMMPIGTGPFVIDEFVPEDHVSYSANPNYREENKPYFSAVQLKGGGDAAAAARAVCQTGEYLYAWNLQVEPDVLLQIQEDGDFGEIVVAQGTSVERIHINFSDPNKEVDGQKSEMNTPHPFLTDDAVRQAMNLATDRDTIASKFYGEGQPATPNILTGFSGFESPNTSYEFNLEKAAKVLEDAGWTLNDSGIREKDGVELKITYATSVNSARQKTQAVVKDGFESIGIGVKLEQVDAGIYFDSGAGNSQNIAHFYWDIDMFTNNPSSPVPVTFLVSWFAGEDGSNIAQKSNDWQGQNYQRWVNEEFDSKYEELQQAADLETASQLVIELNDILIENVVVIPLVNRSIDTYAASTKLRAENLRLGPFHEINYFNIANWNYADGVDPEA